MILQNQDLYNRKGSKKSVVCAREGGANTTPYFSAAHFAKRNTKFGGGESEGGAGIHFPHTPFSARPARAFSLAREAHRQFLSKKVRAFSNKGHHLRQLHSDVKSERLRASGVRIPLPALITKQLPIWWLFCCSVLALLT
jgi:hypothetical protein